MTMRPLFLAVLLPVVSLVAVAPAESQTIDSADDFDGRETWPLLTPETVEMDGDRLGWQRSDYAFSLRFQTEEWNEVEAVIDVFPSTFQGRSAHIIQWTTSQPDGTGAIDALWIDASDFRVYHRVYRLGGAGEQWAGDYMIHQHHPEGSVHVLVTDDGEVERRTASDGRPRFDFATLGFLFGLMELEEGDGYRILNIGVRTDPAPRELFAKVGPVVDMEDGDGEIRHAREVAVLSPSETQLITFYVTSEPPFFLGWDFRRIESGRIVSRVRARGAPLTEAF